MHAARGSSAPHARKRDSARSLSIFAVRCPSLSLSPCSIRRWHALSSLHCDGVSGAFAAASNLLRNRAACCSLEAFKEGTMGSNTKKKFISHALSCLVTSLHCLRVKKLELEALELSCPVSTTSIESRSSTWSFFCSVLLLLAPGTLLHENPCHSEYYSKLWNSRYSGKFQLSMQTPKLLDSIQTHPPTVDRKQTSLTATQRHRAAGQHCIGRE